MNYQTRVTRLTISPPGEPIFSDQTTNLEIEDEAAGEYVKITQQNDYKDAQTVCITPEEWPAVKDAVESLLTTIALWGVISPENAEVRHGAKDADLD